MRKSPSLARLRCRARNSAARDWSTLGRNGLRAASEVAGDDVRLLLDDAGRRFANGVNHAFVEQVRHELFGGGVLPPGLGQKVELDVRRHGPQERNLRQKAEAVGSVIANLLGQANPLERFLERNAEGKVAEARLRQGVCLDGEHELHAHSPGTKHNSKSAENLATLEGSCQHPNSTRSA